MPRRLRPGVVLLLLLLQVPGASGLLIGPLPDVTSVTVTTPAFVFKNMGGSLRSIGQVIVLDEPGLTIVNLTVDDPASFRILVNLTWLGSTKTWQMPKYELSYDGSRTWTRVAPRSTTLAQEVVIPAEALAGTNRVGFRISEEFRPWNLDGLLAGPVPVFGHGSAQSILIDRAEGLWWNAPLVDRGTRTQLNESSVLTTEFTPPPTLFETTTYTYNGADVVLSRRLTPDYERPANHTQAWTNATREGNRTVVVATTKMVNYTILDPATNRTQEQTTTFISTTTTMGGVQLRFVPAFGRTNEGSPIRLNKAWLAQTFNITQPHVEWSHGDLPWHPLPIEDAGDAWVVRPHNFSTIGVNQAANGLVDASVRSYTQSVSFTPTSGQYQSSTSPTVAAAPGAWAWNIGSAYPTWFRQRMTVSTQGYLASAYFLHSPTAMYAQCPSDIVFDVSVYADNAGSQGALLDQSYSPFRYKDDYTFRAEAQFNNATQLVPGTYYWFVFRPDQDAMQACAGKTLVAELTNTHEQAGSTCQYSTGPSTPYTSDSRYCRLYISVRPSTAVAVGTTFQPPVVNHHLEKVQLSAGTYLSAHGGQSAYGPVSSTSYHSAYVSWRQTTTGKVAKIDLGVTSPDWGYCVAGSTLPPFKVYSSPSGDAESVGTPNSWTLLATSLDPIIVGAAQATSSTPMPPNVALGALQVRFREPLSVSAGTVYLLRFQTGGGSNQGQCLFAGSTSNVDTGLAVWTYPFDDGTGSLVKMTGDPWFRLWMAHAAPSSVVATSRITSSTTLDVYKARVAASCTTPAGSSCGYALVKTGLASLGVAPNTDPLRGLPTTGSGDASVELYMNSTGDMFPSIAQAGLTLHVTGEWQYVNAVTRSVSTNSEVDTFSASTPSTSDAIFRLPTSNRATGVTLAKYATTTVAEQACPTDLSTLPSGKYCFDSGGFNVYIARGAMSSGTNTAEAQLTWGGTFDLVIPASVKSGDYILATGLLKDASGVPLNNMQTRMELVHLNGSSLALDQYGNSIGLGPAYNVMNGNYIGFMSTSYIPAGSYNLQVSFADAALNPPVTTKKSWPITIGNGAVQPPPGGPGPGTPVYADAVFYYSFYDSRSGAKLDEDFYKFYISPDATVDEGDRVVGGLVPLVTGVRYYLAVKDYFGHLVFPQSGYACQGPNGQSCPLDGVVPGSHAFIDIDRPQTFLDVGVGLYQLKLKNTQTDPAYVQIAANGKTFNTWVLPGEISTMMVPYDTYTVGVDIYDANLQPPAVVDYTYNYVGGAGPYWKEPAWGQSSNIGQRIGGVEYNYDTQTYPRGHACLDGIETGSSNYCYAVATTTETPTYFGTIDLNRVAKLTYLRFRYYDGDSRPYHNFIVEVNDDPDHRPWLRAYDGTGLGSGWATRTGSSTVAGTDRDYVGLQTLTFPYPIDARYIRIYSTGDGRATPSATAYIEELDAGMSATTTLVADRDQFLWIRGYDLYSVVFAINNANALIYNQQVNVGVHINNQDSTILQQTADIRTLFNNTGTWIGNQLVGMSAVLNNTKAEIGNQFIYQNVALNNTQASIQNQLVYQNAHMNNTLAAITNQFVFQNTQLNNTLSTVQNQFVYQNVALNNTLATLNNQYVFQNAQLNNTQTAIQNQLVYQNAQLNNSFSTVQNQLVYQNVQLNNTLTALTNQFVFQNAALNNTGASIQGQLVYQSASLNNTQATIQSQLTYQNAALNNTQATIQAQIVAQNANLTNSQATIQGQFVYQNAAVNNSHSSIQGQLVYQNAALNNSQATIQNQLVYQNSQVNNSHATVFNQLIYQNSALNNTRAVIENQFVYQNSEINNTETSIGTQINGVSLKVTNLNSTVEDQFNAVEAMLVNQDSNVSAQFNFVHTLINNSATSLGLQLNSINSNVSNTNASVAAQVNLLSQNVSNSHAAVQTQLNALSSQVSTSHSTLANQTNLVQASIRTQDSNLTGQFNYINGLINTSASSTLTQVNVLSQSVANFNASMQTQLNALSAEVQNNGVHPPVDGTVLGYYALDELSGTSLADHGPYANHAALTGTGGAWGQGKVRGALLLDGVNDRASAILPQLTNASFSIAAWVRADSWGQGLQTYVSPFGLYEGHAAMVYIQTSTGRLHFKANVGGVMHEALFSDPLPLGEYHHVGLTYDGETLRAYLDGAERANRSAPGTISSNAKSLTLGATALAGFWKGSLDEAWVYGRAISPGEMEALYRNLNPSVLTQLNAIQANVSNGNALLSQQTNLVSAQVVNQGANITSQFNNLGLAVRNTEGNLTSQVNALRIDISNQNASILAQVNYVALSVNNTGANITRQVNDVWSSVNNTRTSVVDQANIIRSDIVNNGGNVTNQFNALSVRIQNLETGVTTQLNEVWFSVNNTGSNVTEQINVLSSRVDNHNTNISSQFTLVTSSLRNVESNITNQTSALAVGIENVGTRLENQVNSVSIQVDNVNASVVNQVNALSSKVGNSNATILTQVNLVWGAINTTQSNVSTQFNGMRSRIDVFQSQVNTSFALVQSDLSFTESIIVENVTSMNATLYGKMVAVLDGLERQGEETFNQTGLVLERIMASTTGLNITLIEKSLEVMANANARGREVLDATDRMLVNLSTVNASLADAVLRNALDIQNGMADQAAQTLGSLNTVLNRIGFIGNATIADYVAQILFQQAEDTARLLGSYEQLRGEVAHNLTLATDRLMVGQDQLSLTLSQVQVALDSTLQNVSTDLDTGLSQLRGNLTQISSDLDALLRTAQEGIDLNLRILQENVLNATQALDGTLRDVHSGLTSALEQLQRDVDANTLSTMTDMLRAILENATRIGYITIPQMPFNDTTPPGSVIYATPSLEEAGAIGITWAATDSQSPILAVTVYARRHDTGEDWAFLVPNGPPRGGVLYRGAEAGVTYEFRTLAMDAAGNLEAYNESGSGRNYARIIYQPPGPAFPFQPPQNQQEARELVRRPFLVPGPEPWEHLLILGTACLLIGWRRRSKGR